MKEQFSPGEIVSSGLCIGCGSCVAQSKQVRDDTAVQFDKFGHLKPAGPDDWYYQPSESFSRTCPFSPLANNEDTLARVNFPDAPQRSSGIGSFEANYVGHVAEDEYRVQGSSGGMVTWVAAELLRKNLIDGVAHVVALENPVSDGRYFKYQISRTETAIKNGAKSRYYPVELSGILDEIRRTPGRYAIVAIPCMIKAIQLLRQQDPVFNERIRFTLGLFCGHMKSARFVESFAWQMNVDTDKIKAVEYRHKYPDRPANWYNAMITLNDGSTVNKDWWHLADGDWGAGFFMNSACNFCDDVASETADIAFGDAWVEPYSSDGRGTNVIVVRSSLINDLVKNAIAVQRLQLDEVDAAFVEQTQAAGFRQRREGLAYRLTWAVKGVRPIKRVLPGSVELSKERKIIYRMRYYISKWSNRMFWVARKFKAPGIYITWARCAAAVYHGLAYYHGSFKEIRTRFIQLKRG